MLLCSPTGLWHRWMVVNHICMFVCSSLFSEILPSSQSSDPSVQEAFIFFAGEKRLSVDICLLEKEVFQGSVIYIFAVTNWLNPHLWCRWAAKISHRSNVGGLFPAMCVEVPRERYDFTKCTMEILVFNPFNFPLWAFTSRWVMCVTLLPYTTCIMYRILSQCVIWHCA